MQTVSEKIKQRRRQMFVHSYLYYDRNVNIVSDSKWSQWAMELVELQRKYPDESKRVEFYKDFKDWDGSSGAFLKIPEKLKAVADYLYDHQNTAKPKKKAIPVPKNMGHVKKLF